MGMSRKKTEDCIQKFHSDKNPENEKNRWTKENFYEKTQIYFDGLTNAFVPDYNANIRKTAKALWTKSPWCLFFWHFDF